MFENTYTHVASKNAFQVSLAHQASQLLTLGERNGWSTKLLGRAPLPLFPIRAGDWLIVPAQMDNSLIPDRTYKRIQAIYSHGLRPKGFVLVHEAPLQLTSPKREDEPNKKELANLSQALKILGASVIGVGILAGTAVAVVSLLVLGGVFLLPIALTAGVILIDPILIAVMEDDSWIEIDRWSIKPG